MEMVSPPHSPHNKPYFTSSLMPTHATSSRKPTNQWLVHEPNRIERQHWKDRWRHRELFAILAWRPLPCFSSWMLFTQPLNTMRMLLDSNTQLPSEPLVPHL